MTEYRGNDRQLRFRPPRGIRRAHVAGGRWSVRKLGPGHGVFMRKEALTKPWSAYSSGKARYFNRRFETFQEAIAWAERVAYIYAIEDKDRRTARMRQLQLEKYPHLRGRPGKYTSWEFERAIS